jgi:hypothetical protein
MTRFIVEIYTSNCGDAVARVLFDALTLARSTGVRHVRAILVPADEVCFHVVDGASARDVVAAADEARLSFDRIAEAIEVSCRPGEER